MTDPHSAPDIPTTLATLEAAAAAYDAALECVAKGEAWLKTHQPTHPQYRAAQQRLAQRRRELAVADARLKDAEQALQTGIAGLSLRCQVCGEAVSAVPPLQPGRHVHLSCWGEDR